MVEIGCLLEIVLLCYTDALCRIGIASRLEHSYSPVLP